jgi:hypothetical protein
VSEQTTTCTECGDSFSSPVYLDGEGVCNRCRYRINEETRSGNVSTEKLSRENRSLSAHNSLDLNRLSKLGCSIGGIAVVISVVWWAKFYGSLASELDAELMSAFSCLYSTDGICGLAQGLAQIGGVTPYTPLLFWIGIVLLVGGATVQYIMRKSHS